MTKLTDKKRLIEAKKYLESTMTDFNYEIVLCEAIGVPRDLYSWLIEQAEEKRNLEDRVKVCEEASEPISHRLAFLNRFLQQRNIGHWGKSVIDSAVNHIEELEGEIEGLLQALEDKEPYYSNLCLMLEKQNKRYREAREIINLRLSECEYSPSDYLNEYEGGVSDGLNLALNIFDKALEGTNDD